MREAHTATPAIWPASRTPPAVQRADKVKQDSSITGVLVFSGIGLALTVIAAIFQWLEQPPPFF